MTPEPQPAATIERPYTPHPEKRPHTIFEWLPVIITAPFLVMMLIAILPRLGVPFELEWNEGQAGEQAWRFAHGMSLYPSPETGWVPYMYAPLYHILWGGVMRISGVYSLGIGRVISFMASIATIMAIGMIVWDRVRRAVPALFAALLYCAYFKPSGFWYDIARVDALSLAFCSWGMYLTLKARVRFWQGALGLFVLLLGSLTKQTIAPIALYCAVVLIFQNSRAALIGGFIVAMTLANFLFFFERSGNDQFFKYVYTNALKHSSRPEVYFPASLSPSVFRESLPEPKGTVQFAKAYIQKWHQTRAPEVWQDGLRHVWIFVLVIVVWIAISLLRRQPPHGWLYIPPALMLALGGLEGFAKFGGYMNNFLPLFMAICILMGFALYGLRAHLGRNPHLFSLTASVLLLLQIFQPWGLPALKDSEANYAAFQPIRDEDQRQKFMTNLRALAASEDGRETAPIAVADRLTPAETRLFHALRFLYSGLAYYPPDQWPAESSHAAYIQLMDFLRDRRLAGEPVWIVHHQWYSLLQGHRMAMNPDMVRCTEWAGDPTAPQLAATATSRYFRWIILDTPDPTYDWIPNGLRKALVDNYTAYGKVPFLDTLNLPGALQPLTGAQKWPLSLFREKGFEGDISPLKKEAATAPAPATDEPDSAVQTAAPDAGSPE